MRARLRQDPGRGGMGERQGARPSRRADRPRRGHSRRGAAGDGRGARAGCSRWRATARSGGACAGSRGSGASPSRAAPQAFVYSGADGESLRGAEHHFAWCDELAKWKRAEAAWDNLMLGLRAGARPQVVVTTTPRPVPALRRGAGDARACAHRRRQLRQSALAARPSSPWSRQSTAAPGSAARSCSAS